MKSIVSEIIIIIQKFSLCCFIFLQAERAYNLNAAELTCALEAYSSPRSLSRRTSRASILPYDGSEMIVPVMMHSNAGTLRRGMISQRQSIIPYDGSEMIMPAIMHSNGGTLQRNGTLRSSCNHCSTCDRTSYSTAGVGSSHQTRYSDLDVWQRDNNIIMIVLNYVEIC